MRDAVLEGPTTAEIVALARLAQTGSGIPPHLTLPLVAKGWVMITGDGTALLTLAGRVLVDRAETIDLERLASVPPHVTALASQQVV